MGKVEREDIAKTDLERGSSLFPSCLQEPQITGYTDISYAEFYRDVLWYARYRFKVLQRDGTQQRVVVDLYVHLGVTYTEVVVHFYVESSTRASIYDNVNFGEEERAILLRVPGPDNILSAGYYQSRRTGVIPRIPPFEPKDIRLIFHTSAIPKPSTQLQEVDSWIKSLYHVGLTTLLAGRIFHGTCTIQQASKIPPRNDPIRTSQLSVDVSRLAFKMLAVCISHKTKSCGLGRMEYHLINVYGCTESGIPMLRGGFRGGVVADTHPQLLMHILLNDDDGTPLLHYEFQDETIS
ncbi:hypothetical protein Moror_16614, partial [Moniliophthora roreri MCA 2997]